MSGLNVEYDSAEEPYHRVKKVTIWDGEPLNEHKLYTLATKEFLVKGKDGYEALLNSEVVREMENSLDLKTGMVDMMQEMVMREEDPNAEIMFPLDVALKIVNNENHEYTGEGPDGEILKHKYYKIFPKVDGRLKDISQVVD